MDCNSSRTSKQLTHCLSRPGALREAGETETAQHTIVVTAASCSIVGRDGS